MLLDKEVEKKVDELERKESRKPSKASKEVEEVTTDPVEDVKGINEDDTKDGIVIDCTNLNIRKEGKATADVIIVIPVGTEVIIDMKDNTDEFYNVILKDGTEGFAMKKYVKII